MKSKVFCSSLSSSTSSPSFSLALISSSSFPKKNQQYLYGLNQTIQVAGVSILIDAVVAALKENKDRTFSYGEIAFFSRWWREASREQRETVRSLVLGDDDDDESDEANENGEQRDTRKKQKGQLSFVNGGWVQHDEACAFWEEMVDQTARGHSWLADTFADLSVIPTVGWQIDPFGHSATHADLLGAGSGMDAVFFGRADQQDLRLRAASGDLEVVWDGSDDDDSSSTSSSSSSSRGILAGTFASGNYGPPPGFNWVSNREERDRNRERKGGRRHSSLERLKKPEIKKK